MGVLKQFILLADFHLFEEKDIETFVDFLKRQNEYEAVFFLGDIFEFLSYDLNSALSFYNHAVSVIREIAKKKKVYYIEGNHDFSLGSNFLGDVEIEVIKDSMTITLHGRRVMFTHGDGLTGEKRYGMMRRMFRSTPVNFLIKMMPEKLVFQVGFTLASVGRSKRMRESPALLKRMARMVTSVIRKGVDVVITGHYHFPFVKPVRAGSRKGVWICVGGPHYYCEFVNGVFRLKDYPCSKHVLETFELPSVPLHSVSF